MNGRVYDPLTAQFLSPDPFVQAPNNWLNYNRYAYAYGNPFLYTDPDGEIVWFVPIIIGAVIGGTINVAVHWDQIDGNWGKGLAAFGIGAVGGALAATTGGAALGALPATGILSATGILGAGISAGVGYTYGTTFTSLGNHMMFGDPMPTAQQFLTGLGITIASAGLMQGSFNALSGRNFWTGSLPKQTYNIQVDMPDVDVKSIIREPEDVGKVLGNKTRTIDVKSTNTPTNNNLYLLDNKSFVRVNTDGVGTYVRDPNFRTALIKASGVNPGKAAQAHHIFPIKYADQFYKVGIDVNKYGSWWQTSAHQANSFNYNAAWGDFFRINLTPTQADVLREAMRLKSVFGY